MNKIPEAWDWIGYMRVAQAIAPTAAESVVDQAKARTAIGRAYYGVYHLTWEYILANGYRLRKTARHSDPWDCLQERGRTADENEVGQTGLRLYQLRQRADYEAELRGVFKNMTAALSGAAVICSILQRRT